MTRVPFVLLALSAFTVVRPASAQETPAAEIERAKKAYKDGHTSYDLNQFGEAVKNFEESYRLHPDPAFLFNIAQSYRQLNDYSQALRFYKTYLRKKPDAGNRKQVEVKIAELQKLLEAQHKEQKNPPVGLAQPSMPAESAPPASAATSPPAPTPDAPATGASATPPDATSPGSARSDAPPTVAAAASGPTAADLTAPPPTAPAEPFHKDLHKKWWAWAAVGGVVLGVIILGVALSGDTIAYKNPTVGSGPIGPGIR